MNDSVVNETKVLIPETAIGWDAARLDALVDGTIAIVLTLLVLELHVPKLLDGPEQLPFAMLSLGPSILCYILAFVSAGTLWVGHRSQFHYIRRTTRLQLWINLLFLLWVSLMPFAAALITAYPGHWLPAVVYGANLSLAGLALQWNWLYACKRPHLFGIEPPEQVRRGLIRRIGVGQAAYLLGILLAFVSGWISIMIYLLVPALYLLPSGLDPKWHLEQPGTDD